MTSISLGSVFEVFSIGSGPSSSHSIGPERAAKHFLANIPQATASIKITLQGSLALTGKGHMTDKTISAAIGALPHSFVWDLETSELPHPNTLQFEALDQTGAILREWRVWSVGGGSLVDRDGPVLAQNRVTYPIAGITDAIVSCEEARISFWEFVVRHEPQPPWPRLKEIWETMKESIRRGLAASDPHLPGPLGLQRRAKNTYDKAKAMTPPDLDLGMLSAFALAVAEENASASAIVTAPTCGSSGVLPGVLYYYHFIKRVADEKILQALATAGLFGSAIRARASISGAEVGCQGEIGSACSMAAAADAQIMGGTLRQIEYAAEVAMEHHLGLTCDPVEGYVQIPCIERNMMACTRAFQCATFALLTDGRHLVSFDDAIAVMNRTGRDLQSAYRETAQGGLALLWKMRREDGAGT